MGSVCLYPLDNLGHAWEWGGSPWTLSLPPFPALHSGRDFSKEQQGRCQIQKVFGPNSLEIPAYGFFFYSPCFSLGRGFARCLAAACILGYPATYHFPEAGVLPGNLPEPLTPPPPPSEQRAAVCLHLNLDVCIILNLDLLIICIWFLSKKLSNADVLISALAWGRNTKFADFHCLLKQWPVRSSRELQSRSHRRGLTYQS